ncbi:hypothetical protein ACPUYX_00730 [Desulfosporosinus sp. SYSU MS00001]|uniref:hypothetical protein n=1 Tax=Desulfosporosinus sp. SYSU MS00001 TaxID=3416284 RepID=UPI003CF380AE
MQKKKLIFFTLGLFIFVTVGLTMVFFLIPTSSVFAVEARNENLGITISPGKELIRVKNMAPGDKVSAPLTVINKGKKDFSLDISAEMERGDKLYNKLDLIITDPKDNSPMYSGKLSGLKDLDLGILDISKNKTLNIAVGLPNDAGNEYQGIYTSMKFVLTPFPISQSGNNNHTKD